MATWLAGSPCLQEITDALDVAGDVRHDGMPGVVVIEDGCGVETPTRFGDFAGRWGVGPTVEDELVFSHNEIDVCFGLHVEGRGSEDRGMEPGEGFAGCDIIVENMVG